jgi:hypothetical protein
LLIYVEQKKIRTTFGTTQSNIHHHRHSHQSSLFIY